MKTNRQNQMHHHLILCFFLIFASIGAVETLAQNADANTDEKEKTSGIEPGYNVALGARDPFLSPDALTKKGDTNETSLKLLRDALKVTIVVFGESEAKASAFVNNQRVGVGDKLTVTVAGTKIALPVVKLHKSPSGVRFEYDGQEFDVFAR